MSDDDALNEISCFNHFFPKQMVLLETKDKSKYLPYFVNKKVPKTKRKEIKYTILKTFK